MEIHRRQLLQAATATAAVASVGRFAYAQTLESAQIILGFPAGSGPDVLARKVAEKLRNSHAKTVMVDNRSGAAGQIAVTAVKGHKPDGSSILLTPMAVLSVYPHTYKKLPYDPVADLTPVTTAVTFDMAFVVGPAVPATVHSIPDFMAWSKAKGQAIVGSPAMGSSLHFAGILLGRACGIEVTHVGYRGTVAAISDLLGGRLPAHVCPVGEVLNHRGEGKLRVLGTSGVKRNRFTADVPTFAEQGFKDTLIPVPEGYAFFLPAKAPADVVTRLNAALRQALGSQEITDSMAALGLEPSPSTPAETAAYLDASSKYWGPVVKSIGFTAES